MNKTIFKIISVIIFLQIICVFDFSLAAQADTPLHIDLDVKDMNIIDVLRLLAEQGQVNIVASRNVQGRVTAKMKGVTVEQALGAILDANNFVFSEENGIVKVLTQQDLLQQEQTEKLITRVFLLKNLKAANLRQALNSMKSPRGRLEIDMMSNQVVITDTREKIQEIEKSILLLDRQLITQAYVLNYAEAKSIQEKLIEIIPKEEAELFVDERTNTLVVRAIPPIVEQISLIIKSWDRRASQVLIEAKILEVSLDKTKGLGISWEYLRSDGDGLNVATDLSAGISGGGTLKIGTLSADEYQVTLRALESSTDTNILSNPRIVAIDNTEANILVGSAEPYLTTYIDKESNTQTEETKFMDVGVKLKVTPKIGKDGYIRLKIHPEVSSARRVAEVNNALAVDTTQADTTVVVKNAETIVLAGLIKDKDTKIKTKVPILGDIPLLGVFFRSKLDSKVKKEIVVFITPYILKANSSQSEQFTRNQAIEHALEEAEGRWGQWEEENHEQE